MNNIELSYIAHSNNISNQIHEKDLRLFHINNKDCIGYQLILKTLNILQPFLDKKDKWLTIGDYNGLEANFLLTNSQEATASDITDVFLIEANKEELIKEFSQVNVENIHYQSESFDYVLCKEAFHHFPKAYMGLYEMIRVSKKATIIIEPIDIIAKMPLLLFLKNLLDRINPLLINKIWKNRFSFEIVGNYIFKISEREIEKLAMGIGLRYIAFKGINLLLNLKIDKSIIFETPMNKFHWRKIIKKIKLLNILSRLHIIPHNHLCCIVFKEEPEMETLKKMEKAGYTILQLPENPYIKKMAEKDKSK
jgi:2-polyprenyl-3-methyl-5-hydroxy-6-metoxy-1,4-benzoquinol methylase